MPLLSAAATADTLLLLRRRPILCTIGLESFSIKTTRSPDEDTLFLAASLAIGDRVRTLSKSLGDHEEGARLDQFFHDVPIFPGESAVFTYVMVNNGDGSLATEASLQRMHNWIQDVAQEAAQKAANAAAEAIVIALGGTLGSLAVPVIGTALGVLAGKAIGTILALVFGDCDGPVAFAVRVLTYDEIYQAKVIEDLVKSDEHVGEDLKFPCRQSNYTVVWSVK